MSTGERESARISNFVCNFRRIRYSLARMLVYTSANRERTRSARPYSSTAARRLPTCRDYYCGPDQPAFNFNAFREKLHRSLALHAPQSAGIVRYPGNWSRGRTQGRVPEPRNTNFIDRVRLIPTAIAIPRFGVFQWDKSSSLTLHLLQVPVQ